MNDIVTARAQEVRHKSMEGKLWRDAFIQALEQEKEELLYERKTSNEMSPTRQSRTQALETTSQKIKKVKDELRRVEEQDKDHTRMFHTLQESALKKAKENLLKEKVLSSNMRREIDETKRQLDEQRHKYKEVQT